MMRLRAYNSRTWEFLYHVSDVEANGKEEFVAGDMFLLTRFPLTRYVPEFVAEFLCPQAAPGWASKHLKPDVPLKGIDLPAGEPRITSKGVEVCRQVRLFFSTDLFMHPPLEGAMQFAPHQLVFAPSQTGKSFVSDLTGRCYSSATVRALMGFGTADREIRGILDRLMGGAISIDEIPELIDEANYSALLTLMATGTVKIAKGVSEQDYICNSPIRFMGNPPQEGLTGNMLRLRLFESFDKMLGKLTNNPYAFGSRFGGVMFGFNYASREGTPADTSKDAYVNTLKLARAKMENGAVLINELDKHRAWLSEPLPAAYLADLDGYGSKVDSAVIKDFLKGFKLANTHARGMALRASIVENGDKEELLNEILEINASSFADIVECESEFAPDARLTRYGLGLSELSAWLLRHLIGLKRTEIRWEELPLGAVGSVRGQTKEEMIHHIKRNLSKFYGDFELTGGGVKVMNPGVLSYGGLEKFKKGKLYEGEQIGRFSTHGVPDSGGAREAATGGGEG